MVESSLSQQATLTKYLEADGDIKVIGAATTEPEAVALVSSLAPGVVTLDLLVSGSRGRHAIEQIMGYSPTPILVLSGTAAELHSAPATAALMAGALDVMPKPSRWGTAEGAELRRRVRVLNGTRVIRHPRGRLEGAAVAGQNPSEPNSLRAIVALAASTGGPPALATVMAGLRGVGAPVLIVQHIHPNFIDEFAAWMRRVAPMPVNVARDGERLLPDVAYVAPGGTHLRVSSDLRAVLDAKPETVHRPSANELFFSLARLSHTKVIGALLTGMGEDGAEGLLAIRSAGGFTVAQDARTSAVHGMPAAAVRLGAAGCVLPLELIATALVTASQAARQ
jgi:two-component system chemotaxis response regulator CheB